MTTNYAYFPECRCSSQPPIIGFKYHTPKPACAITKEFPQAILTHKKWFPKAAGAENFWQFLP